MQVSRWHAQLAWLPGGVTADVLIECEGDRITSVTPGAAAPGDAVQLPGLTLPGLANAHSHAFHRALRGRTHSGQGSFWTWREQMYAVANRLNPDAYLALARAVYAEMALAGITCVGEFHYLHHGPDGVPYDQPNAMGDALVAAAADAGIRITLLDTCYLTGGVGQPLEGAQLRFGDRDVDAWATRAALLRAAPHVRIGAAIHSVRAVPPEQLKVVVAWAGERSAVLHMHLSEQRAENDACLTAYGRTPTAVLADAGAIGPHSTAVHATHLTDDDIATLGGAQTNICMCPTTERDLADGIGPMRALSVAGARLTLGSDSHAVIDLFEEARAVELDERLRTEQRGHWPADALLQAATADGHASLGWPEAGVIAVGAVADLVTLSLDTPRLAGTRAHHAVPAAVFAATAADVRQVVVSGRQIVRDGVHLLVPDVAGAYRQALAELLP